MKISHISVAFSVVVICSITTSKVAITIIMSHLNRGESGGQPDTCVRCCGVTCSSVGSRDSPVAGTDVSGTCPLRNAQYKNVPMRAIPRLRHYFLHLRFGPVVLTITHFRASAENLSETSTARFLTGTTVTLPASSISVPLRQGLSDKGFDG